MTAMIKETKIFCKINPLITDQLSATVASLAGIKVLTKIIINGMTTRIKETTAKGINNIQFLLVRFGPNTLCFKILESKLIRVPFYFIYHDMNTSSISI